MGNLENLFKFVSVLAYLVAIFSVYAAYERIKYANFLEFDIGKIANFSRQAQTGTVMVALSPMKPIVTCLVCVGWIIYRSGF